MSKSLGQGGIQPCRAENEYLGTISAFFLDYSLKEQTILWWF